MVGMIKLKWYVDPEPTGPYRSFQRRGWPTCYNGNPDKEDCDVLATIVSLNRDGYEGHYARATDLRLKVRIYFKIGGEHRTGLSKEEFSSIAEAKLWLKDFYKKNPQYYPFKDK
ncbi:hypothetical protein AVU33_gp66 [Enterobacteria phage JenP2]|uniref:Uncharacterized protein n=1 Tax=Enterobacteria phage JenP2 TaxID=1610838 RepID=A0A0E3JPY6_9CAUD|nr:hypothetical protein AVU33_gp66 [Enterobacteria phage JenP2]AKA61019.1 hypothetical protein [Enterobacteria phage JenP2]